MYLKPQDDDSNEIRQFKLCEQIIWISGRKSMIFMQKFVLSTFSKISRAATSEITRFHFLLFYIFTCRKLLFTRSQFWALRNTHQRNGEHRKLCFLRRAHSSAVFKLSWMECACTTGSIQNE